MFNALSQLFAVLRASISAHNALHHMNYSQIHELLTNSSNDAVRYVR